MVCAAALLSGCDFAHRLPDAPGQVYYDKDQKPQSVLAGGKSGIQSGVVVIEVPTPPQPAAESDAMFAQTPRPALAAPTSGGAVAPKALELPPATNGGGAPAINGMRTNGSVLAALTGRAQADSRNKAEAQMKPMTAQAAPIPPAPQMAAPQTASPQTAAPMRMAAEAPKPAMADYGAMAAKPAAPMQADRFRAIIPEGVTVVDVAPGAAGAPQPMAPPAMAMAAPQPMTPPAAAPTAAPRISAPQMAAAQSDGGYVQLDGGQVVLIRPLIGAPAEAGMALARALAQSVGSPADAAVWRASPKRLTLSGSAIETAAGAGRALAVDWRLSDANGAQVGAFVERQAVNAGGADLWASVNGDMLVSLGRRTADRMSRALTPTGPQAPRMAAAPAPAAPVMTAAIAQEPAAAAPRPRLRPARAMAMPAPQPTARRSTRSRNAAVSASDHSLGAKICTQPSTTFAP